MSEDLELFPPAAGAAPGDPAEPPVGHPTRDEGPTPQTGVQGCYLCRPHDPAADDEGCSECEREFWEWYERVNEALT